MSLSAVSSKYPVLHVVSDELFNQRFIELRDWILSEKTIGPEFVGADCWGLAIHRADGLIDPQINTYALFDAIGRSFGRGMKPHAQYRWEKSYREAIIADFDILLDQLCEGDAVIVYMFGEPDSWGLRMSKMNWGYSYQYML